MVGGTGNRGVVSAASYEARKFGVRSAMPSVEARRLCPDGVFLPGDMAKYARESRRIFGIFGRFTPAVEGLSLDEAFLDLTGSERLLGPAADVAERLRREVRAETGLAVSVGIAPVKMVAKIASDSAKPDGLLEVKPGEVRAFLDPLPIGRLWGVGPVTEARLRARGRAYDRRPRARDSRCAAAHARRLGARGRAARARRGRARRRAVSRGRLDERGEHLRQRRRGSRHARGGDPHARGVRGAAAAAQRAARAHGRAEAEARAARRDGAARLPAADAPRDARRAHRRRGAAGADGAGAACCARS